MQHPATFAELIQHHLGSKKSIIATHHTQLANLPSLLHEGLVPEKLALRAGLTTRKHSATGDENRVFFYAIDRVPKPAEQPPSHPFVHVFVKLPASAPWVRDQRREIPKSDLRHAYAEVQSKKRVKPKNIIALQIEFEPQHRTMEWFTPIRSGAVRELYARVALKQGETVKKKQADFDKKSDEEIAGELGQFVQEMCGKNAGVKSQTGVEGMEIHVPWIDLAIAAAKKKGIPVYGWDGKLIE